MIDDRWTFCGWSLILDCRFNIWDFRSGANCLAPIFEWHEEKGRRERRGQWPRREAARNGRRWLRMNARGIDATRSGMRCRANGRRRKNRMRIWEFGNIENFITHYHIVCCRGNSQILKFSLKKWTFGDYKAIKCRLSHSGVRHENLSETYLKPIRNLCRREGSGRS